MPGGDDGIEVEVDHGEADVPAIDAGQTDVPTVDPAALDRLATQLDSVEIVQHVVRTYLDELPRRLTLLSAPVSDGRDVLRDAAHALKSTSAMLGAAELARRCQVLESVAGSAPEAEVTALCESVRTGAVRVAAALTDWLATS